MFLYVFYTPFLIYRHIIGHRESPWESGAYSRYSGPNSWESRKEDIDFGLEEEDAAMKNRYRGTNYGT